MYFVSIYIAVPSVRHCSKLLTKINLCPYNNHEVDIIITPILNIRKMSNREENDLPKFIHLEKYQKQDEKAYQSTQNWNFLRNQKTHIGMKLNMMALFVSLPVATYYH